MSTYIFRRLLLMIPTLFGIVVVSFFVIRLAPGDPASLKYGGAGSSGAAAMNAERGTEAAEKKFRERYHFDEPLYVQFGWFCRRLVTGDLMVFQSGRTVWEEIGEPLRVTIILNVVVLTLIYVLAIPCGILSASSPGSMTDRFLTFSLFMMYSLPSFWVAELLRMNLRGYFPLMNLQSEGYEEWSWVSQTLDFFWHAVLPIACMTYGGLAYLSRQMRAGMLEVIRQDYIRTAEAKGCSRWRVILVHALRNSLFPVITLSASLLPYLISGSVVIEFIFNIRGMGLKSYEMVLSREYDFVMLTLLVSAVLTLLGILVADILYVVVNPRVQFDER